jgi:hypothetical protein
MAYQVYFSGMKNALSRLEDQELVKVTGEARGEIDASTVAVIE